MQPERKMGENARKLLSHFIATEAIPSGGNFLDGMRFLMDEDTRTQGVERAMENTLKAIDLVKSAHDNPYGDDDEAISAAILERINQRRTGNAA